MYSRKVKLNGLTFKRVEEYSYRLLGYDHIDLVVFRATRKVQWYMYVIQFGEAELHGPYDSFVNAANQLEFRED